MSETLEVTGDEKQFIEDSRALASDPERLKKKSEPRPYVVLQKVVPASPSASPSASQTWVFARNVTATSAEQAIRQAAELIAATSEDDSFTLVAVPARNFKSVTVEPQVQTKLKFS